VSDANLILVTGVLLIAGLLATVAAGRLRVLVALADGRYAFTGQILGVGPASALQDDARRRLAHARSDSERTWWREVIGALAR
jgi:hypothetical protein